MTNEQEQLYNKIKEKINHLFYCEISYKYGCLSIAYEYFQGITEFCKGYSADIVYFDNELFWLINNYDIESKHYKLEELDNFIEDFISYYSSIKDIIDILE